MWNSLWSKTFKQTQRGWNCSFFSRGLKFSSLLSLQQWNYSRRPDPDLDVFTLVRLCWTCLIDRYWFWLCRSSWTPCTSTSRGSTSSRRRTTQPRCSTSSLRSSAPSCLLKPSSPPSQPIRTSWWVIDRWRGPIGITGQFLLFFFFRLTAGSHEVLKQ